MPLFFANAPLSLGPGASTSLIPLFSVLVALGTPAGTYTSNNFTILGGVLTDDFNPIGAADFDVTVTVAPEPGTLLLLATGALGLGIRKRLVSD